MHAADFALLLLYIANALTRLLLRAFSSGIHFSFFMRFECRYNARRLSSNQLTGQGYASEAARAVLRLADALGHRRVIAHHFADNPASLRLLEARGFQITGVRDVFSKARNTMVPLVESRLSQADFANRHGKA